VKQDSSFIEKEKDGSLKASNFDDEDNKASVAASDNFDEDDSEYERKPVESEREH